MGFASGRCRDTNERAMPSIEIETGNVAAKKTRVKSGSRKARPRPITSASVGSVLRILRRASRGWDAPVLILMAAERRDPFRTLIGCILSLRTKDETTAVAAPRLFELGD